MHSPSATRFAVIGGGISGLAAAHRLSEIAPGASITLFEAGDRLGGVAQTIRRNDFLIERSADSIMNTPETPWCLRLCERIGFADQLQPTESENRGALLVHRGKLVPLPEGFTLLSTARMWPVLTTPVLSLGGKIRLAYEYFVPRRTDTSDESLANFARRRLGREVYERIVQPLVGGIYTADPEQLSMHATMRSFVDSEQQYGSLLRAARHQAAARKTNREVSGARYNLFVTPRNGLSSFVEAIAHRLPQGAVRLQTPVLGLGPTLGNRWQIVTRAEERPELFDGVIVATPAPLAGEFVNSFDNALARELKSIPHAGSAVVVLAYRRDQIAHPLNAFGYVAPHIENRPVLAGSFSSVKFAGRAPSGKVLLRAFLGGALQSDLLQRDDGELERIARDELASLLSISGAPEFSLVIRWQGAMPQYHVGHLEKVARIEKLVESYSGFELAGNALRGVGIPHCIRSGENAAERVYASVRRRSGPET